MRSTSLLTSLMLALSSTALAQPRDAGRIQSGEDLTAWRTLQRDAPDDVDALVDFLEAFPSSPLAELAYRELVEAASSPSGRAQLPADFRGNTARLSTSYHRHQEALSRTPAGVAVARLEVSGAVEAASAQPATALRWERLDTGIHVETGAALTSLPAFYAGVGAQAGALSLTGRGLFDEESFALGAALRYDPWRYWRVSPFAEAAVTGPDVAVGLSLGGSLGLAQGLSIEVAGGGQRRLDDGANEKLLRAGIAQRF